MLSNISIQHENSEILSIIWMAITLVSLVVLQLVQIIQIKTESFHYIVVTFL